MMLTVDTESRTTEADHLAIRLWLRMLACTNRVGQRVSANLRDSFGTTLPSWSGNQQAGGEASPMTACRIRRWPLSWSWPAGAADIGTTNRTITAARIF